MKDIIWTLFTHLRDLNYADDLALLSRLERKLAIQNLQYKTTELQKNSATIELNINIKKTKVVTLNCRVPPKIEVNGNHNYFYHSHT